MSQMIYAGSVGTPAAFNKAAVQGSISGNGEGTCSILLNDDYSLRLLGAVPVDNAGVICISADKKYVYAANECKDFDGGLNGSGGGVTALKVKADGTLEKINDSISYGSRTSSVAVTEDNRYLVVSNHGSHTTVVCRYIQNSEGGWELQRGFDDSSIALFKLREDGGIGQLCDLKVFEGHGYWVYGGGQSTSHLHCVRIRKDYVIGCNRGADCLELLKIDRENEKLTVLSRNQTRKGLAPRHAVFHPSRDILYVCNENYACASVYGMDCENGSLRLLQTVQSMPDHYMAEHPVPDFIRDHCSRDEKNTSFFGDFRRVSPSDIHISGDGKKVYLANRTMKGNGGSIAVYQVLEDGTLEFTGINPLEGGNPRGFNLLDDSHLIVGLLDKDLVCVYSLDERGMFKEKVCEASINSCASFVLGR